jgi:hypothetical protein
MEIQQLRTTSVLPLACFRDEAGASSDKSERFDRSHLLAEAHLLLGKCKVEADPAAMWNGELESEVLVRCDKRNLISPISFSLYR